MEPLEVSAPPQSDAGPSKTSAWKRFTQSNGRWHKRFARQQLPGWSPIITAKSVVFFYFLAGIILIPLGIAILIASLNVVEYKVRYDNAGAFAFGSKAANQEVLYAKGGAGVALTVSVTVAKRMEPPVYVYYDLNSYYQNYRRYVRSLDSKQLGGGNSTSSTCAPAQYVGNNGSNPLGLPNGGKINPCGLIAVSNFNDSFSASIGATPLAIDESNLAWSYDQQHLYGHYLAQNFNNIPASRGGNTTDTFINESQHFMVWMRPSAHATVRKLYGVVHSVLEAGTVVTLQVQNRYNTYNFGGEKFLVLSTDSWMGGKNNFLGILYLVLGSLAWLIAFAFFLTYYTGLVRHRKFGDLSELSWNRKQS